MIIPTPLLPLAGIDREIHAKIEYLHPSGSMKHRSLPAFIEALIAAGEIKKGQRLAIRSAGSAAVTVAWAGARLCAPVDAVLPHSATPQTLALIEWLGGTCHVLKPEEATALMQRLHADKGTYVVAQANEPRLISHYEPVGREILAVLPNVAAVTVGIGTGLSVMGVSRALEQAGSAAKVYGVEPAEAAIASGKPWAPHHIPGLAPPIAQPLLDKSQLAGIIALPSQRAWDVAREVAAKTGFLIGPSSGAAVAAAMQLRQEGTRGAIVAVCASSMYEYLGTGR
ncbi:MAG: pyridoxal-phosphate dependent enzyme [Deltaproteobacteria bacterium]|nr:pyridoxal-phosphate dependent enzyme [Deltaproteobacteria bacterium]